MSSFLKSSVFGGGLVAGLLLSTSTVKGQGQQREVRVVEKPATAGLVNDWLRKQSPSFEAWDIGAQVRLRYEIHDNAGTFPNFDFQATGVDRDNNYFLAREKVHVGYTGKWFGLFAEGRDSSSSGDDHPANPGTDTFDLYQAYLSLGNASRFPITAKVGRQELIYGEERLVGASDWSNVPRSFDAAKLRFENTNLWVDAFIARPVIADDHNFNVADDYDWFSGIYASSKTLLSKHESQVDVFSRNSSKGASVTPRDIYTLGLRLRSLPGQFHGWDYSLEGAGQLGSANVGGARLRHEAVAGTISGGYTWTKSKSTPRLGLEYNYASGDENPKDNKDQTFDNLFPTNHKFYGTMDLVGWRNIHNPKLTASFKPSKKLFLAADYNLFWLADTADFFFPQSGPGRSANGYGRNPGYSSFVGSELDLELMYVLNSWSNFKAGYGHFFVGNYVKQSKAALGGAKDADWIYLQTTFNF